MTDVARDEFSRRAASADEDLRAAITRTVGGSQVQRDISSAVATAVQKELRTTVAQVMAPAMERAASAMLKQVAVTIEAGTKQHFKRLEVSDKQSNEA